MGRSLISLSKMAILAAGLTLALSTSGLTTVAKAQGSQNTPKDMLTDVGEEEAVFISPKTMKVHKGKIKLTAAHHTKAMQRGGRELSSGAMIYRHAGQALSAREQAQRHRPWQDQDTE